ncbi:Crp/Fnr family transcriptional regulator [Actinomadura kijaniata]|uniref:Crp/Fnr family transcriptional regulator n=1 Tax=Actinomadura kijaniata TaxID=46161 RepID=UPI003F1ACCDE
MMWSRPERRWERPPEHSFWLSLSAAEREAFEEAARERVFPPGAVLCAEGDRAGDLAVLRSGWVKVTRGDGGTQGEQIVALRGPGDLVGERAALTLRSRSASVTALDEVRALALPASRFHELVTEHPRLVGILERQERERLAEDDEGPSGDVEHRLAYLLGELALRRGEQTPSGTRLSLPVSRGDVARWVGASRRDVARVLEAWQRDGIVATARRSLTVVDAHHLDARRRRADAAAWSSLNCSILYTDVAGFSASCRNEADRAEVRVALYTVLRRAFEESGIPWGACYHEDRGDGVLVIVPPAVPTRTVADPLLAWLAVGLRRHNRRSSPATGVRLRVALHVGPVTRDREGVNGDAVIHAARMLDAGPLREALDASGADLAFLVSDHVFDTAIRADVGMLDAEDFRRVDVEVKGTRATAWLYTPGGAAPEPRRERAAAPARVPADGTHFHGTVYVRGDVVAGDKTVNGA